LALALALFVGEALFHAGWRRAARAAARAHRAPARRSSSR